MVALARGHFGLPISLRLGHVKSGGPRGAPAWVEMPSPMPAVGTMEFRKLRLTIYIREQFLNSASAEMLTAVIAHEISHILLDSGAHKLRREEEAVDLTAMIFGFGEAYGVFGLRQPFSQQLSYLNSAEIAYAVKKIYPSPFQLGHLFAAYAKMWATLAAVILFAIVSVTASIVNDRRQSVCRAEQAGIEADRESVNNFDQYAVDAFNGRIEKFNRNCVRH